MSSENPSSSSLSLGWLNNKPKKDQEKRWKEPQVGEVHPSLLILISSDLFSMQLSEVFSAIDRKDDIFLMDVRDHAFHLLLRKSDKTTPWV